MWQYFHYLLAESRQRATSALDRQPPHQQHFLIHRDNFVKLKEEDEEEEAEEEEEEEERPPVNRKSTVLAFWFLCWKPAK